MENIRQPLRDVNTNSPSVKRQRLSNKASIHTFYNKGEQHNHIQEHQEQQESQQQIQQQYAVDKLPFSEWQRKWRKIMLNSTIYFDGSDSHANTRDLGKIKEKSKAITLFTRVGAHIQAFFDSNVTIVITSKPHDELSKNILAYQQHLKIWDYTKALRFLGNLGETSSSDPNDSLSQLLQNEKVFGANDRDPNAKRDDFYYFKHPYFFVHDLRNVIKPIAIREWKPKEKNEKPWPHLHKSSYGHSLFQADPADAHIQKKVDRRRLRYEQQRPYRERLREVYDKDKVSESSSPSSCELSSPQEDTIYDVSNITKAMPPPPPKFTLSRQASTLNNKYIEAQKRDCFEIEASGYNGSTNVSQRSTEFQTKNGLAPAVSSVASKQVSSLTKRIIEKRQKLQTTNDSNSNVKPKVSGYCENCRIGFEDFDEHIVSGRHRSFAEDDGQFRDIDDLIKRLKQDIQNKR
ncbi:hypothetical protein WICMUC_003739 [Wickerhamomyces mucosus]|uniref:DBF4-type domain-containing protein n=1 Tax=Wickerhamomyces mucosus TaxID=1378264 RepID=A0A9P8TCB7_9ASCO|nr:hypothetical protein WICMUC_003739 [Wickerhamomyces mucosus]